MRMITHSSRSTFQSCNRRYEIEYILGIKPMKEPTPFRIGGAVHIGIDSHEKGVDVDAAMNDALLQYEQLPAWVKDPSQLEEWAIEREQVGRLLSGYFWYWSANTFSETLATELEYALPLLNPNTGRKHPEWVFAGKIDKIVKLHDGRLAVREHKTTSDTIKDPTCDYRKRLSLDSQISGYIHAARRLGYDIETVDYDCIRKATIRPSMVPVLDPDGRKVVLDQSGNRVYRTNIKKNGEAGVGHGDPIQSSNKEKGWTLQQRRETAEEWGERLTAMIVEDPQAFYQRWEIPRLEADLKTFERDLWHTAQNIGAAMRYRRWPRNTAACVKPYRCPYIDICLYDLNSTVPDGFRRTDNVHEELVQVTIKKEKRNDDRTSTQATDAPAGTDDTLDPEAVGV